MATIKDVLQHPGARLTQQLSLSIGTVNATLDVLNFRLEEGFNQTYTADISVTSSEMAIDGAACVGRRATFTIDEQATIPSAPGLIAPVVVPAKIVHGVVTQWERVKASRDEVTYKLRIEPRVALLDQVHDSGVFQNTNLKKLITDLIVDRKLFDSFDIEFALEDANEQFEQTVMYEESVWNFISRHCLRAGVFWYFRQGKKEDGPRRDTIVFGDNPRAYERALELPLMPRSGLTGIWHEAILDISTVRRLVPESIELWEHNYRTPEDPLKVEAKVARGDRSLSGSVNRSTEHYHDAATGKALVNARRDEQVTRQTTFTGTSDALGMRPGMVVRLTNHELAGAKHGIVITKLVTEGSRTQPAFSTFEGTPSHLTYRPEYVPAKHWRWVTGTIPAVVASDSAAPYAPLDGHGRYPVKPQFLRSSGTRGSSLLSLRLLRPSASYQGGFHSPLLPGTVVRLAATNGDIDRLYIAGALNDFSQPDIVHGLSGWESRAVWRSPLLGAKIRMEDRKGREGVKIATVYMKSSVSLGYLVDSQKKKRGEGFEISTQGWGSMHAPKGLFLSADALSSPNAPHLEMQAALSELQSALSRVTALVNATTQANAIPADKVAQENLLDALDQLKSAGLIASAPGGIAIATPRSIQQAASENVMASAGRHIDFSAVRRLTLAAGDLISLFAHKLGLKIFAAKGKVEIQAQSDALDLLADKQLRVASVSEDVLMAGKTKAVMASGGASFTIENGSVVFNCPGEFRIRAASFTFEGPQNADTPLPALPQSDLKLTDHYLLTR